MVYSGGKGVKQVEGLYYSVWGRVELLTEKAKSDQLRGQFLGVVVGNICRESLEHNTICVLYNPPPAYPTLICKDQ